MLPQKIWNFELLRLSLGLFYAIPSPGIRKTLTMPLVSTNLHAVYSEDTYSYTAQFDFNTFMTLSTRFTIDNGTFGADNFQACFVCPSLATPLHVSTAEIRCTSIQTSNAVSC